MDLVDFIHSLQDARLSLERLSEIHNREDEEPKDGSRIYDIPKGADLNLDGVSFQYGGPDSHWVLRNLKMNIPGQKITAIVGGSGSGKTTLLKLLLKFYDPQRGDIQLATYNLKNVAQASWRDRVGVVMQEGFIFSDTIANNIAVGVDEIDKNRLVEAAEIANIKEYIEDLPLAYNTKIGADGIGISGGQKQRIAIARAILRNPAILILDEATSALDSESEKLVQEALNKLMEGRTSFVIAHRLSTIKKADMIIATSKGKIVEQGTHDELVAKKGMYAELVNAQTLKIREGEQTQAEQQKDPDSPKEKTLSLTHFSRFQIAQENYCFVL